MTCSSVPDDSSGPFSAPTGSAEPMVRDWRPVELSEVLSVLSVGPAPRGRVVAIDGRSGSGKSTLAQRLQALVPGSVVVATDDVAWHFSMFDWSGELSENVLLPFRQRRDVHYRPPGWRTQGRAGAIEVPASASAVFVEGVGASRAELVPLLDASVWVQSDHVRAREQCLARDVASGVNGDASAAAQFWEEWQREEEPFLERDRPWTRAALVIAGVPLAARGTWMPVDTRRP